MDSVYGVYDMVRFNVLPRNLHRARCKTNRDPYSGRPSTKGGGVRKFNHFREEERLVNNFPI